MTTSNENINKTIARVILCLLSAGMVGVSILPLLASIFIGLCGNAVPLCGTLAFTGASIAILIKCKGGELLALTGMLMTLLGAFLGIFPAAMIINASFRF